MVFQQKKIKYLLTTSAPGSAAMIFDFRFAQEHKLQIVSVQRPALYKTILSINFWKFIIFGYAVASYSQRLNYVIKHHNLKKCECIFSRSLAVFISDVELILFHNLEHEYYYEEYKSRGISLRKFLDLHQYIVLKIFEQRFSLNTRNFFISKRDADLISPLTRSSVFVKCCPVKKVNMKKIKLHNDYFYCFSANTIGDIRKSKFIFFGNYSNSRNVNAALKIINAFPDLRLYGTNSNFLPLKLKEKYHGFLDLKLSVENGEVLFACYLPLAGVQTKIMEWIEAGGILISDRTQIEKLGIKIEEITNIGC